jgi:hypothetical protein
MGEKIPIARVKWGNVREKWIEYILNKNPDWK